MSKLSIGPVSIGAAAALTMASAAAVASAVTYTSAASFQAAVSGASTFNFQGIAPPGGYVAESGPLTLGGVAWSSPGLAIVADAGDTSLAGNQYGQSFFSGQGIGGPSVVNATLAAGTTAIDFYYGSYASASEPVTLTLDSGEIFQLITPAQNGMSTNFIGLTSSTPITRVTFSGSGYSVDITQFGLASASPGAPPPVPLPPSVWLLLSGIGATLVLAGRRRPVAQYTSA